MSTVLCLILKVLCMVEINYAWFENIYLVLLYYAGLEPKMHGEKYVMPDQSILCIAKNIWCMVKKILRMVKNILCTVYFACLKILCMLHAEKQKNSKLLLGHNGLGENTAGRILEAVRHHFISGKSQFPKIVVIGDSMVKGVSISGVTVVALPGADSEFISTVASVIPGPGTEIVFVVTGTNDLVRRDLSLGPTNLVGAKTAVCMPAVNYLAKHFRLRRSSLHGVDGMPQIIPRKK